MIFQSTHPRGVRLRPESLNSASLDFNPRTHVGCDLHIIPSHLVREISIHAPTWGATPCLCSHRSGIPISIHAPTWGATCSQGLQGIHDRNFNPRTHVGCDFRCHKDKASPEIFQSTHPRGVRPQPCQPAALCQHFNPRTHVGCDTMSYRLLTERQRFQSTHPRGVRPGGFRRRCSTSSAHFNPRTHVGCDLIMWLHPK